jgi:hypothetical protein
MKHRRLIAMLILLAFLPAAASAAWAWQATDTSGGGTWFDKGAQFGVPFLILVGVGFAIRAIWVFLTKTAWPQALAAITAAGERIAKALEAIKDQQAKADADLFTEVRALRESTNGLSRAVEQCPTNGSRN